MSYTYFLLFLSGTLHKILVNCQYINNCQYDTPGNRSNIFTNKLWKVCDSGYTIYYSICGSMSILPNETTCMINDGQQHQFPGDCISLGSGFEAEDKDVGFYLKSINGDQCLQNTNYSLEIDFQCADDIEVNPKLTIFDKCRFKITMLDPNCTLPCTKSLLNNFIDLRLFRTTLLTHEDSKFLLSLCGPAEGCKLDGNSTNNRDISVCEITKDNVTIPIASTKTIDIDYKHNLIIKGELRMTDRGRALKYFQLSVQCQWNSFESNLHFIKKPKQGKKYDFEMKSSLGCLMHYTSCVITDDIYIYNLSQLYYDRSDNWLVKNYEDGKIWLNICGPLKPLKAIVDQCGDSNIQVCDITKEIVTNRGSTLSRLELKDDILEATFQDGSQCLKNKSHNYRTIIQFHCHAQELGPYFELFNGCDMHITWRTPRACPEVNAKKCNHADDQKGGSCFFQTQFKKYDLSPLTMHGSNLNRGHVIKNGSTEFIFNICGSVLDEDAPCLRNYDAVMKILKIPNKKHRVLALGRMNPDDVTITDNSVIINYKFGTFCREQISDYESQIILECSDTESKPELIESNQCFFKFRWQTKYACPLNECVIYDTSHTNSINVDNEKKLSVISVKQDSTSYTLKLCGSSYRQCHDHSGQCEERQYKHKILRSTYSRTLIELSLSHQCDSVNNFNQIEIDLECDPIFNNSHFVHMNNSECVLKLKYVSNTFCNMLKSNIIYHKSSQVAKCSLKNNLTGQLYPLNGLNLQNVTDCPNLISLDNNTMIIKLLYDVEKKCSNLSHNKYHYQVSLKCAHHSTSQTSQIHENQCLDIYQFDRPDICDFFPTPTIQKAVSITGISLGVILVILAIVLLGVYIVKAKRKRYLRYVNASYNKYGDL